MSQHPADRPFQAVNVMNINWADNWLHLPSALAGVVIVFLPERSDAPIR